MPRSPQLDDTAKKLPTMFPASLKDAKWEGDYSPSPKVWDDKAGFDAKVASFAKVVTEAKAKIKDLDSLKANFARHRQGMRRLPRDLPRQEGLSFRRFDAARMEEPVGEAPPGERNPTASRRCTAPDCATVRRFRADRLPSGTKIQKRAGA